MHSFNSFFCKTEFSCWYGYGFLNAWIICQFSIIFYQIFTKKHQFGNTFQNIDLFKTTFNTKKNSSSVSMDKRADVLSKKLVENRYKFLWISLFCRHKIKKCPVNFKKSSKMVTAFDSMVCSWT